MLPDEHRIVTTERVDSSWAQTVVPAEVGERFALVPEDASPEAPFWDDAPFWLVVPEEGGFTLVVAAEQPVRARLIERSTGTTVAVVDSPGGLARYSVGA